MAEKIKIKFRDREIEARTPTHADIDLGLIEALRTVLLVKQNQMRALEEEGAPKCGEEIAKAMRVASSATDSILERVRDCAKAIGDVPADLASEDTGVATKAAFDYYGALREALGVGALDLGKS